MAHFNNLSNREWEVARLLLQGKSNKLIASSLGISERTVEFHLKNIYTKYQVSSRVELILKLGHSTVDGIRESIENRDRLNSWMGWAAPFRETISVISAELEMKNFLNLNNLLMLITSLLLLFVNWLAFHDFQEAHTVRDWLMLIASALVILKFAWDFWNRQFGQAQG